jgi:hypothetical protein
MDGGFAVHPGPRGRKINHKQPEDMPTFAMMPATLPPNWPICNRSSSRASIQILEETAQGRRMPESLSGLMEDSKFLGSLQGSLSSWWLACGYRLAGSQHIRLRQWSGPSALVQFSVGPFLGRCPRLIWLAPSALIALDNDGSGFRRFIGSGDDGSGFRRFCSY